MLRYFINENDKKRKDIHTLIVLNYTPYLLIYKLFIRVTCILNYK